MYSPKWLNQRSRAECAEATGDKGKEVRSLWSRLKAPDKQIANADNVSLERQLDEVGRASAIAMGKALRELKNHIGAVFTKPGGCERVRSAKADPLVVTRIKIEEWPEIRP